MDGAIEPLSKEGSFVGQHIYTSLQGAALHINAFNFPVWGMLEKLAPTLLAGVPAIVKPASATSYLTEAAFRVMIESGVLPPGAVQLIVGGVGDLFDHLGGQDVVSFTGSASTALKLRTHPTVMRESVKFIAEQDSLNASLLGPDAAPGTPEFDLFVREVAIEMTVKAGQKCTAIRRAMAPAEYLDAVQDALAERLAGTKVGDPRAEDTRMGALVSLSQRDDVRQKIAELEAAGARIVAGDPSAEPPIPGGAFLSPVLLRTDDPWAASAVHDVEPFGPVSTIMPYRDLDDAIALANRGIGSLALSLFTHSPDTARDFVQGAAAYHGRMLVIDRTNHKESTGHGSPLPVLVHGGPGRAGGGEEMGGMRGVKHYMQRTAVQGSPRLLSAVTGRWIEGADVQHGVHPFRKSLAELRIGDQLVTAARQVTLEDVEHFAHFTGDTFYAHMDAAAAKANPFFDDRVAHGYLIASFAAGLFVDPAPGPVLANYGVDNMRFLTPVYFGDTLQVRLTCKEINPRANAEHGEVRWDCQVTKQTGAVVAQYDVLTMVAKVWPTVAQAAE
jgi:oxepin-CoA hydrolase/3-oxo-5,6-dehydrosuberyl-CoA semialdehyde dehydrogenase